MCGGASVPVTAPPLSPPMGVYSTESARVGDLNLGEYEFFPGILGRIRNFGGKSCFWGRKKGQVEPGKYKDFLVEYTPMEC